MEEEIKLTQKEEKIRKNIQSKIEYCMYDQPYDDGEVVWVLGDRQELYEIFQEFDISEKSRDRILDCLYCPSCGNEHFDLGMDIGIKTKFEKDVDKNMDKAYQLYGKEVEAFLKSLEAYPLLALKNKFAKRINKEIKEKKLPIISVEGNFFRARRVENSEVVSSNKMYNPPLGKPTEGRFNHAGQSHLYLANEKIAAIKEVTKDEKTLLVWYQEFEIFEKVDGILDLSFDWSNLTPSTSTLLISLNVKNSIGRSDGNKENWKPDYFLTRFIMDCAKNNGYNGIKYNSSRESFSFDIVLFYPDKIKIKPIGNPSVEIFLNKDEKEVFTTDLIDL